MKKQEYLDLLYGQGSVFTQDEQAAMHRGYTMDERNRISGRVYGIYPQAISQEHADKLDKLYSARWYPWNE